MVVIYRAMIDGEYVPKSTPTPPPVVKKTVVVPSYKTQPTTPTAVAKAAPKVIPKVAPSAALLAESRFAKDDVVVPKVAPSVTPKVTPKVTPRVTPRVNPTSPANLDIRDERRIQLSGSHAGNAVSALSATGLASYYGDLADDRKASFLDSLSQAEKDRLVAGQEDLEDRVEASQADTPKPRVINPRLARAEGIDPVPAQTAAQANQAAERQLRAAYWDDNKYFVDETGEYGAAGVAYRATYNETTGKLDLARDDEAVTREDGATARRDTAVTVNADRSNRSQVTDRVDVAAGDTLTETTTLEIDARGRETSGSAVVHSVTGRGGDRVTTTDGTQTWRTQHGADVGDGKRIPTSQHTVSDVQGPRADSSHSDTTTRFDAQGNMLQEVIVGDSVVGPQTTHEDSTIDYANNMVVKVDSTEKLVITGIDEASGFATYFEQTAHSILGDGSGPVYNSDGTLTTGTVPNVDLVRLERSTDPHGGFTTDDRAEFAWSYHAHSDATGVLAWDPITFKTTRFGASGVQEESKIYQVAGLNAAGSPIPLFEQFEPDDEFARSQVPAEYDDVMGPAGEFIGDPNNDEDWRRHSTATRIYEEAVYAPQVHWAEGKAYEAMPAEFLDVIDADGHYIPFDGVEGKDRIELEQAAWIDSNNGHEDRVERFQQARELWEETDNPAIEQAEVQSVQGKDERDGATQFHDAWNSFGRGAAMFAQIGVAVVAGIVLTPLAAAAVIGVTAGTRAIIEQDAVNSHREGSDQEKVAWALADGIGMIGGIAALRLTRMAAAAGASQKVLWGTALLPQVGGTGVASAILGQRLADGRPIKDVELGFYLLGFLGMGIGARAFVRSASNAAHVNPGSLAPDSANVPAPTTYDVDNGVSIVPEWVQAARQDPALINVASSRNVTFGGNTFQRHVETKGEFFGVTGNYNKAAGDAFQTNVRAHINSPDAVPIIGTFGPQREPVVFFVNPKDGLMAMFRQDGSFVSGWKLNDAQFTNVMYSSSL